ncbi:uncharacterized protein LOC5521888 isoform X2 [Nematostella vectensis]|uniref:uncharacterized protein LOC5521888 isoform X2 n=1 Tax=Nematostella vectensis TaxID=45351 RepID=UPI00139065E6|nr:uncharacterized protein LOC5521888 isoform X2 [Nematostella vectensis]
MRDGWACYLLLLGSLSSICYGEFPDVAKAGKNSVFARVSTISSVLSGDVNITFYIPKQLVNSTAPRKLVVHVLSDQWKERLRTFKIPIISTELKLRVPCDTFDHAATYTFKYRVSNNGPTGLLNESMAISWGNTRIEAPRNHTTLTRFGSIWIYHDRVCLPRSRQYRDQVNLYFVHDKKRILITQRNVRKLRNGKQSGSQNRIRLMFSCDLFDTQGVYYFEYVSGFSNKTLSTSSPVSVRWSKHELTTPHKSILPCSGSFSISFAAPECHKTTDTIKVYEQLSRKYITERPALPGQTAVFLPCTLFNDYIKGYCFRYTTISSLTGKETVQSSLCVSTLGPGKSIYDGWSQWSFWNLCSSSCGQGRRYRYRFCLSLTASGDQKKDCVGKSVMWEPCALRPCPETRNRCACGCRLTEQEGMITSSPQLFKKPNRSQCTWVINIQGGKKVKLWFDALKLDGDYIFVRDGNDSSADLLAKIKRDDYDKPIISSGNSMYLYYYHVGKWINGTRRGFTASYTAEGPPAVSLGTITRTLGSAEISFLAIFIVGVLVMGGLLLTVFMKLRRQHVFPPSSGSSTTSESTIRSTGPPSPLEDEASSNEPLKGGDRNARKKPAKSNQDRKRRHKERRTQMNERLCCESTPLPRCTCAQTELESGSNSLSDGSPQRRNSGVYRTLERTVEECECPQCVRQQQDYYLHEHFGSPEKKYYGDWMHNESFQEPILVEMPRPGNYRRSFPQYV